MVYTSPHLSNSIHSQNHHKPNTSPINLTQSSWNPCTETMVGERSMVMVLGAIGYRTSKNPGIASTPWIDMDSCSMFWPECLMMFTSIHIYLPWIEYDMTGFIPSWMDHTQKETIRVKSYGAQRQLTSHLCSIENPAWKIETIPIRSCLWPQLFWWNVSCSLTSWQLMGLTAHVDSQL